MANYSMNCSCGHTMTTEAGTRDAAVSKFKGIMTQATFDQHWTEMHKATEQKPSLAEAHAGITQMVTAA